MSSARELLRQTWAGGRPLGQCPCCHLKEEDFPSDWWTFHVTACMRIFFARHWAMRLRWRERHFDKRRMTRQFAARRAA